MPFRRFRSPSVAILIAALPAAVLPASTAAAQLPYYESFDGPNGDPWPAPWTSLAFYLAGSDLQGNRGRMSSQAANGSGVILGRMLLPGFAATDIEALMTLEFEDVARQGIGFYARQNGGTLQEYAPHGQGYAFFLKGGWAWPEDLGIWREIDGQETQFATGYNPVAGGLQNGVRYRVRYRVTQHAADSTLIRAKVWPEAESEPAAWTVETFDSTPELQGTAGAFALDLYNYQGTASIFVDDLLITDFPNTVGAPFDDGRPRVAIRATSPLGVGQVARIALSAPDPVRAAVRVFDAAGRNLGEAFQGPIGPGTTEVRWNPVDGSGRRLPGGVYFFRMSAGERSATVRIVLAG